jgi:hypothetical protein
MTGKRFWATWFTILTLLTGAVLALNTGQVPAQAQTVGPQATVGTAFTYQSRLTDDQGEPLTGVYDFQFTLYDGSGSGAATVGNPVTVDGQQVNDGYFTVQLDFGANAFTGEARWLEIGVREGSSSGSFTTLTPRQPLNPAPYALALPGLRTDPSVAEPNIIGGYGGNSVDSGVAGATIGGGGASSEENRVTGDHGTVGGGSLNTAGTRGTVGGGQNNNATANATIGGGLGNAASEQGATVGGGQDNAAEWLYSTVGGGLQNRAAAYGATVGGGAPSDTSDPAGTRNRAVDHYGTVGGGGGNQAGSDDGTLDNAQWATVGGGQDNAATADSATVGGGEQNQATGSYAVVAGGRTNVAGGTNVFHATVGGGVDNQATGLEATVGGGNGNVASGDGATIPGGWGNEASGNYSFAAGYSARAQHSGSFVWADNVKADFASTAGGQFLIRAGGGVGIGTNAPATQLHVVGFDAGTNSDPNGHVVLIEDENDDSDNQVLALKTGYSSDPTSNNNFVTFFNGDDTAVGSIEGDSGGGVTLNSGSADFAEWLPKHDPAEALAPGDVVGIFRGKVSEDTEDAERALVVSTAPIVSGNYPGEHQESQYVQIAFVGQVPVKVRGRVDAGDYIVPSGREDGSGVAVAPEAITVAQVDQIVGQALEDSDGSAVTKVNTLVGLPREAILQTLLQRRDAQIEQQAERLEDLEARIAALENALGDEAVQTEGPGRFVTNGSLLGGLLLIGVIVWQRRDREGP